MAIKFLEAHEVGGESFKKGQVVKNRTPASEMHFVRRGVAAFCGAKGKDLTDHEGKALQSLAPSTVIVHNVSNARSGNGVLPDGTAPRAPSGPVTVTTTAEIGEGEVIPAKKSK